MFSSKIIFQLLQSSHQDELGAGARGSRYDGESNSLVNLVKRD